VADLIDLDAASRLPAAVRPSDVGPIDPARACETEVRAEIVLAEIARSRLNLGISAVPPAITEHAPAKRLRPLLFRSCLFFQSWCDRR
jgi:hypothetical protein